MTDYSTRFTQNIYVPTAAARELYIDLKEVQEEGPDAKGAFEIQVPVKKV